MPEGDIILSAAPAAAAPPGLLHALPHPALRPAMQRMVRDPMRLNASAAPAAAAAEPPGWRHALPIQRQALRKLIDERFLLYIQQTGTLAHWHAATSSTVLSVQGPSKAGRSRCQSRISHKLFMWQLLQQQCRPAPGYEH